MKTETKHNLVLRKETSSQGYFTYKVVDPATGRVVAKRTATRHFVAALFKVPVHPAHAHGLKTSGNLPVTTRPIKIANCFGRTDLIQTTMCKDKYWTAGEVDQLLQGNVVKGYMLATIDPAEVNLNMNIEATTETEAWKQKAKAAEKELKELQEEHEALKEQVAELEYQGEEDRKTIARQSGRIINLEGGAGEVKNVGFNTLSEAIIKMDEFAEEEEDVPRYLKIQQWLINLAFAKDLQWDDNYHQVLFQRAAELLQDDNMVTSEVLAMQEAEQEKELKAWTQLNESIEDFEKDQKSWSRLYTTYQQVCESKGMDLSLRLSAADFIGLAGGAPPFYAAGRRWSTKEWDQVKESIKDFEQEKETRMVTLRQDLRELYDAGHLDYLTD